MKYTKYIVVLFVFTLAGCGSTPEQPTDDNSAATSHTHNDHGHSMEKMKAELAKLSPEDAKAAERQHFCPVSGEMLGSMGVPQKIDVNGHKAWICCDGCKDKLLAHPDEYLAKLKKE